MKAILKKLLALQGEVGAISKDETNPFFKSKYFDINGLLEHVKPILTKHGLVVLQPIDYKNFGIGVSGVTTIIVDSESGEQIESFMPLPEIADPQKMGGAITYYRRYSLQSLLCLQAEDDDGNAASASARPVQVNTTKPTGNAYAPLELADTMPFGKHKGKTVGQVVKEAPDYISWMLDQGKTKFSPSVLEAMKGSGGVHGAAPVDEAKIDDLPF